MNKFKNIDFQNDKLIIIDQTKLPLEEKYIITDDYNRIASAIQRLEVRGAPAIGIAAAYAIALAFKVKNKNPQEQFEKAYKRLFSTRPTAVNLFWALNQMRLVFDSINKDDIYASLLNKAREIHNDDIQKCSRIAENGLKIFRSKSNVLTHCNTGQLATGGGGTAFYVIKNAFDKGLIKHVYADETRPLLQGSRLTAFELSKAGIPFSINVDSAAALIMKQGKIDLVITGADRIAANGDSANKIGTYSLAVLCKYHKIPFYIAAPSTTIDKNCAGGNQIKIELRNKSEINKIKNILITKDEYEAYAPAFDVTPNELITAIITDDDLFFPPFNFK